MATDRGNAVDTSELRAFRNDVRALDSRLDTDFGRIADKKVAEFVADKAEAKFKALPGVGPLVAPSVKALATATEAVVRIRATNTGHGSPLPPHGPEFGGRGRPSTQQFQPHRGRQGYATYPAIRENESRIVDIYGDFIEDVARPAFPN